MAGKERSGLLRLAAGQPHRPEPSDPLAALAKAAVAGDRAAVRTFLVTVGPHLLRVVRSVLGASHPDVDDVAQQSAFAVMDALPRRPGEPTVLDLVCRVALLTATNVRRRDVPQKPDSVREPDAEVELLPTSSQPSPEAPVLAGDEARIERIARHVQKGTRRLRLSPRVRQAAQSMALGMLIAGVSIAAIELSRWHPRGMEGTLPPRARSARNPPSPALAHDQRLVPVAPEPAQPQVPGASASQSLPLPGVVASTGLAPSASAKFKTAGELFADANMARVHGDARSAIAISRLLENTFPNSTEGITTHLSLGVLYLQQGQPALALEELKVYRHIGDSAVMAEALWGEEQALQQLGRPSDEHAVLEELLQNYPRSAYAGAAEKRLAALNN